MKKNYSERRLWYFICGCGRRAQSHRRFKAEMGKCQVCRRNEVPDNQPTLMGFPIEVRNDIKKDEVYIRTDGKGNAKSHSRVS